MVAAENRDPERADASPSTTLGDVIFRDRKPSIDEGEWVALVRSIAEGDTRALHALYRRTHPLVFTVIMRITRNRQTAEELTVDVFHDVWRRASAYDPTNGPVIGWLLNQARSRAIDRHRFEHRQKRADPGQHEVDGDGSTAGPHEALEQEQEAVRLRAALTTLTPDERAAIEAAFFTGLTHAETATKLEQPLGTVKTRIRSGLDKLRRAFEKDGGP